jgi:hypothetical protein
MAWREDGRRGIKAGLFGVPSDVFEDAFEEGGEGGAFAVAEEG